MLANKKEIDCFSRVNTFNKIVICLKSKLTVTNLFTKMDCWLTVAISRLLNSALARSSSKTTF
jgi:hypothetical protein